MRPGSREGDRRGDRPAAARVDLRGSSSSRAIEPRGTRGAMALATMKQAPRPAGPRWLATFALIAVASCAQVKDGFAPVLGDDVTLAEKERFARRLYLDMTGSPATDAQMAAILARLDADGNTARTRDAIAAELVAAPELASLVLAETESAAFGGGTLEGTYSLICEIIRGDDTACLSCTEMDACACACPSLAALGSERQAVRDLAADFVSGGPTTTSDVERAVADTGAFQFNGTSPEGITILLFQTFLGRPAEADELKNGRFMIQGAILPDNPAGLLFHRHGASYDDLLDIVFESEVYRDAMVGRAFQRYLGRRPTADELRHFSAQTPAENPDLRPVIRALVSSSEYFNQ